MLSAADVEAGCCLHARAVHPSKQPSRRIPRSGAGRTHQRSWARPSAELGAPISGAGRARQRSWAHPSWRIAAPGQQPGTAATITCNLLFWVQQPKALGGPRVFAEPPALIRVDPDPDAHGASTGAQHATRTCRATRNTEGSKLKSEVQAQITGLSSNQGSKLKSGV